MTDTMKAIRLHEYGGPEVLQYEDAPRPEAGAGEVLVRVHAAGINPVDWKTREGGMARRYQNPFPLIVGWDISGVVEAVGPGASKFKPGDEVFGMVRFPDIGSAYAEYVNAPETHLALKPQTVSHIDAAAVPLAALTAWQAFFEAGNLGNGQRLLIQGAAGGVGHLAVQIAKAKGAYVIGTASPANIDYVLSLGADEAVGYDDAIDSVDMVLNAAGMQTLDRSLTLLKPGGRLVSISGGPDQQKAQQRQVKADSILVHTDESQMHQIAQLMAAGQLKPTIAQVFPLAEAAQAQEVVKNRAVRRGKIVLEVVE